MFAFVSCIETKKKYKSKVQVYVYFLANLSMQQQALLSQNDLSKSFETQQVKASFTKLGEKMHDVVLEVNSQKFLIRIKTWLQKLEQFEVLAVRGFVELWVKILNALKRIVTVLYFQS